MVYVDCGMHYVYLLRGHYDIGVNRVQLLARLALIVNGAYTFAYSLFARNDIGTSVHQKSSYVL